MSEMSLRQNQPSRRRRNNNNNNHSKLYRDLIETQTYLEDLQSNQARVEAWRRHRKSTIDTVRNLQKRIDAAFVACNVAKGAGALTGIAGVAALVVGAILKAKGHESAAQFFQASKCCSGASAVTALSSKLVEYGITQSSLNEIERIIKKDMELTRRLRVLINCSHKVESLFRQIFQCNILSTIFADIIKACGHGISLIDAGLVEIDDLIRDLQSCKMRGMLDLTLEVQEKVSDFFRKVQTNPSLLEPMKAICKIFDEMPDVPEFVKLTSDIFWMGFQIKISGSLSEILSPKGVGCPSLGSVVADCVLNVIEIAFHVVTFKEVVNNIQEGKSKYSESLNKIIFALNSELKEVTRKMSGGF